MEVPWSSDEHIAPDEKDRSPKVADVAQRIVRADAMQGQSMSEAFAKADEDAEGAETENMNGEHVMIVGGEVKKCNVSASQSTGLSAFSHVVLGHFPGRSRTIRKSRLTSRWKF